MLTQKLRLLTRNSLEHWTAISINSHLFLDSKLLFFLSIHQAVIFEPLLIHSFRSPSENNFSDIYPHIYTRHSITIIFNNSPIHVGHSERSGMKEMWKQTLEPKRDRYVLWTRWNECDHRRIQEVKKVRKDKLHKYNFNEFRIKKNSELRRSETGFLRGMLLLLHGLVSDEI